MYKMVGFGKKASNISHEECVKHHREVYAPKAASLLGPRGSWLLKKYIAYYVEEALILEGGIKVDRPYDLGAIEWFEDEFFRGMETWRKTPEGITMSKDEEHFIDRKSGNYWQAQENVIVRPEGDGTGITVVLLATKRNDMSHEECVKYHKEVHAPTVTGILGSRLKKYVAYYVDQAFTLVEGVVTVTEIRPYNVIVITRFDDEFWKSMETWRKTPEGRKITEDEERFIDRKSAIALVCQENVFIP